jgi:hypothetical protein
MRSCARAAGRWLRSCAAIASAAWRPIPCACSIARFPKTSPSSTLPSILDHLCDLARRISTRCSASADRGIAYEVRPRWCAGSITTCAPLSKSCTGHWARKIPCWAAAATTALAESLGSRVHSPGIGFSIGEDRLVMSVEEEKPDDAVLDLYIAPLGDAGEQSHAGIWRAICARRHLAWKSASIGKLKRIARAGQQAGRPLCPDRGRQRDRRRKIRAERHGVRRAGSASRDESLPSFGARSELRKMETSDTTGFSILGRPSPHAHCGELRAADAGKTARC